MRPAACQAQADNGFARTGYLRTGRYALDKVQRRSGDKMHLGPEQTTAFVRQVLAEGTYVICHQTLTYGDNPDYGPAICRSFFEAYAGRSPALILLRACHRLIEVPPPPPGQPDGGG